MSDAMPVDVTIVGGGMIAHDLLLPSVYHLQRTGQAGSLTVCAQHSSSLGKLRDSGEIRSAFPGQTFTPYPAFDEPPDRCFPDLYKSVIAAMKPRQAVVVAMPDSLHYAVVKTALEHDQHVLCVKPFVLEYRQSVELEGLAKEKGLFIGVEYHKRFDTRALMARRHYEQGHFGEFIMGEAKMIEPYFYRNSNFQNWFTTDVTDPFVYVGCHYVDLVCFITRLKPVRVSVSGVKGRFPNGKEGFMWANGRVIFENGAILSVTDGLGYPDEAAGSNEQCLSLFFEGTGKTGHLKHDDQFRGVQHSYLEGIGCAGSTFNYVSPDFYQLVPWEGPGYKPSGYGFASVAAIIGAINRIHNETVGSDASSALEKRRAMIREIDEKGLIATPANSSANELVMEAARLSILNEGRFAEIIYGDSPQVHLQNGLAV